MGAARLAVVWHGGGQKQHGVGYQHGAPIRHQLYGGVAELPAGVSLYGRHPVPARSRSRTP